MQRRDVMKFKNNNLSQDSNISLILYNICLQKQHVLQQHHVSFFALFDSNFDPSMNHPRKYLPKRRRLAHEIDEMISERRMNPINDFLIFDYSMSSTYYFDKTYYNP